MKDVYRSPWIVLLILSLVFVIVSQIINVHRTQRKSAEVVQLAALCEAGQRQALAAQGAANKFQQLHAKDATNLDIIQQQIALNVDVNRLNLRQNTFVGEIMAASADSRPSSWPTLGFFLIPLFAVKAFKGPKTYEWLHQRIA